MVSDDLYSGVTLEITLTLALLLYPGLEFRALQDLDLGFHGLKLVAAKLQQLRPTLVAREQLVQRQLARLEASHQPLKLLQGSFIAGR